MSESLNVTILWSPVEKKETFNWLRAASVSSQNRLGNFDILPKHANFITLIYNFITVRTEEGKELKYSFKRGVLEVSNNNVLVFLGL